MLRKFLANIKNFDWVLFGAVFLLICFGLAAIYSIAISADEPNFGNFRKQIIFAVIGLAVLFTISFFDYRFWQNFSYLIYGITALALIGVLFFGTTVSGTTGWFSFFGFNFQPVELAKLALIIFLSWFLSSRGSAISAFKNFLITAAAAWFYFMLVAIQPDLGSAVILFFIWLLMVIFAGVRKKHLFFFGLIAVIFAVFSWFFILQSYQKDRVLTFIDPSADPYVRGYNVRQSVIAVGAGGLLGRGLGFGSQSQLKFIPASETDFIFAVIAEELGFFGISLILFLWGLIFYRLIRDVKTIRDNFSAFFILGVSAMFFSQIMVNIGMNIGLVPVTGISLPFLSYGGSFLVISLALVGIVEGMIVRNKGNI